MKILYWAYLVILLAAFCTGLIRMRFLDRAGKVFCFICGWSFITESIAYYTAVVYHNNIQVYVITNVIEMFLVCLYFNYSIDCFRSRGLGMWIGSLSLLVGVLNTAFFQPPRTLNTYFMVYEGIATVGICFFAFAKLLIAADTLQLKKTPHFWIMATLTGYWAFTLLWWGIYQFFVEGRHQQYGQFLSIFIVIVNIVAYSGYGLIFFLYPKMKGDTNV